MKDLIQKINSCNSPLAKLIAKNIQEEEEKRVKKRAENGEYQSRINPSKKLKKIKNPFLDDSRLDDSRLDDSRLDDLIVPDVETIPKRESDDLIGSNVETSSKIEKQTFFDEKYNVSIQRYEFMRRADDLINCINQYFSDNLLSFRYVKIDPENKNSKLSQYEKLVIKAVDDSTVEDFYAVLDWEINMTRLKKCESKEIIFMIPDEYKKILSLFKKDKIAKQYDAKNLDADKGFFIEIALRELKDLAGDSWDLLDNAYESTKDLGLITKIFGVSNFYNDPKKAVEIMTDAISSPMGYIAFKALFSYNMEQSLYEKRIDRGIKRDILLLSNYMKKIFSAYYDEILPESLKNSKEVKKEIRDLVWQLMDYYDENPEEIKKITDAIWDEKFTDYEKSLPSVSLNYIPRDEEFYSDDVVRSFEDNRPDLL